MQSGLNSSSTRQLCPHTLNFPQKLDWPGVVQYQCYSLTHLCNHYTTNMLCNNNNLMQSKTSSSLSSSSSSSSSLSPSLSSPLKTLLLRGSCASSFGVCCVFSLACGSTSSEVDDCHRRHLSYYQSILNEDSS